MKKEMMHPVNKMQPVKNDLITNNLKKKIVEAS
jgi:hypothetical protein